MKAMVGMRILGGCDFVLRIATCLFYFFEMEGNFDIEGFFFLEKK